jgi:hypothetical protein
MMLVLPSRLSGTRRCERRAGQPEQDAEPNAAPVHAASMFKDGAAAEDGLRAAADRARPTLRSGASAYWSSPAGRMRATRRTGHTAPDDADAWGQHYAVRRDAAPRLNWPAGR